MIDKTFVEKIEQLAKENEVKILELDGQKYATKGLTRVKPYFPEPQTITFRDLDSIVDMVMRENKMFNLPLYVAVKDFDSVSVLSEFDPEFDRAEPYRAVIERCGYKFGMPYGFEEFVIALRSAFVPNEDLTDLLEFLKSFTNSEEFGVEDNGVSQTVKTRNGVSLAKYTEICPIRNLAPFRTFSEVEQPKSNFLFRITNDRKFLLIEADGGAWKNAARKNIKNYLGQKLQNEIAEGNVVVVG